MYHSKWKLFNGPNQSVVRATQRVDGTWDVLDQNNKPSEWSDRQFQLHFSHYDPFPAPLDLEFNER
jgi:hypothetical protein